MFATYFRNCVVACGVVLLSISQTIPAKAEIPFRLGAGLPGSQSAPSITPFGRNGNISAFLSPGGGNQFTYVNYHSISGDLLTTIKLQYASGPTTGAKASSTAAVSFRDASALIFFSAAARVREGQDIFVQRLSASRGKAGAPVRVNEAVANLQSQVFAARLSNGNVLATWLTHGAAPSSFNLRGRVVNSGGGGTLKEVAVTVDTVGAQAQTGIAALTNGNAVIAYFVKTGSGASAKQTSYVQLLGPTGARIGTPKFIKEATGILTYGVEVAALPGGGFQAFWFAASNGGRAELKRQIFQANGTPGAATTFGSFHVKPASPATPKVIFSEHFGVLVLDGFASASGTYGVAAYPFENSGQIIFGHEVVDGAHPFTVTSLSYDSTSDNYYLAWTEKLPSSVRSFGYSFSP